MTLLVIEDDERVADLIRRGFEEEGWRVTVAYDGQMGRRLALTPKEFKLLEYMLLHQDRLLTRAEIAEKVWDTHFDTGTNFIDVYINYLRKKIDRNFEPKLIHTKPGVGFILETV